jgi:hypothetical protein
METIEIGDVLKAMQTEHARKRKELTKLEKVISALRELSTNSTPTRNGRRHRMSAAARRKIGRAQKLRWSKWRQTQKKRA